ncbi:MAG: SDR family NAD(P)-dependent oxidoreductase [Polyangiales bacterium]
MQSQRPLAAITGACSAIGYELARQFAQHGYDLIAVSEDDGIERLAGELAEHGCQLKALQLDMATLEGQRAFVRAVQWEAEYRPLDALAIHASVGVCGEFARETPLDEELSLLELDVLGSVRLTKALLPHMIKQRHGRVLLSSSKAALHACPYEAVYAASKAFMLSFAGSLRAELKDTGVSVTALLAGDGDAALTARTGFRALMAGEERASASVFMGYERMPLATAV